VSPSSFCLNLPSYRLHWTQVADYDVTIFKVHYGKMTLKIYTKGERGRQPA
jgi:hypothetical protein